MCNSHVEIDPSASLGDRCAFKKTRPRLRSATERSRGAITRETNGARAESRALFWGLGNGDGYARHLTGVRPAKAYDFNRRNAKRFKFPFPPLKPWAVVSRLDLV